MIEYDINTYDACLFAIVQSHTPLISYSGQLSFL